MDRSFLVLFFKKELLPSPCLSGAKQPDELTFKNHSSPDGILQPICATAFDLGNTILPPHKERAPTS
jgi:hypothetical protein